ncbi:hypothetical protein F5144DRAFT_547863 [Chaetomium tenue]|uniref:Uncharacterized protein n=1 Tax=Chaetomium tenue TaxID=1854479 RepID=A0ACB7P8P6_9PEZI|nr:hypothetical protein F5144DRAFT_547863 [Chaetomium globosum]
MASGSTALGAARGRPVTKPLEQYVDDLTVNSLIVVGPSGGVIADECRPSKVDEGGSSNRIDQALPSWDFGRGGPRSEMANDAMSHDRQLQSSSEATSVRWTVDKMSSSCMFRLFWNSSAAPAPRSQTGQAAAPKYTAPCRGQKRGVYQSMGGGSITNWLQFGVGGWPRVVVPKKASCFPQLGSSWGRGARDLEGGAPSLRLDTSPAAPTRMDAQVMSIKDTSRTTFCGPKERGHGLCRDRTQAQPHSARRRAVLVAVMRRPGFTGLLTSDFDCDSWWAWFSLTLLVGNEVTYGAEGSDRAPETHAGLKRCF